MSEKSAHGRLVMIRELEFRIRNWKCDQPGISYANYEVIPVSPERSQKSTEKNGEKQVER